MCGIVGYIGKRQAVPILLDGLARLEYRGYDSAGVAVLNGAGVEMRKLAGRVVALRELVTRAPVHGQCGIAHTRWATHGSPNMTNAHPHADCTGTIAKYLSACRVSGRADGRLGRNTRCNSAHSGTSWATVGR